LLFQNAQIEIKTLVVVKSTQRIFLQIKQKNKKNLDHIAPQQKVPRAGYPHHKNYQKLLTTTMESFQRKM